MAVRNGERAYVRRICRDRTKRPGRRLPDISLEENRWSRSRCDSSIAEWSPDQRWFVPEGHCDERDRFEGVPSSKLWIINMKFTGF